jgi:hypothetical protein
LLADGIKPAIELGYFSAKSGETFQQPVPWVRKLLKPLLMFLYSALTPQFIREQEKKCESFGVANCSRGNDHQMSLGKPGRMKTRRRDRLILRFREPPRYVLAMTKRY